MLDRAVAAAQGGLSNPTAAAKEYNVPRQTIVDTIRGI